MFDLLGWGELILILSLALVIIGPKDLPKVFYTLGRWVHRFKKVCAHFQEEWEGLVRVEQLKELEKELNEAKEKSEKSFAKQKNKNITPES
ncbi:MAG: Sec-independent protein translocase subunit TatA/TatB [Alphaproteobacteria bacterium]